MVANQRVFAQRGGFLRVLSLGMFVLAACGSISKKPTELSILDGSAQSFGDSQPQASLGRDGGTQTATANPTPTPNEFPNRALSDAGAIALGSIENVPSSANSNSGNTVELNGNGVEPEPLGFQQARRGSSTPTECPPRGDSTEHCVVITIRNPTTAHVNDVIARVRADGIRLWREGPMVLGNGTDGQLRRVFGVTMQYYIERAEASSSGRRSSDACLADVRRMSLPAQYRRDISNISVGHQICE